MVGHRFLERMIGGGHCSRFRITAFCEESRPAYDRVGLTSFFSGKSAEALSLVEPGRYEAAGIELLVGDRAIAIDREARTVTSAHQKTVAYDQLVLATGSYPFVPPIPNKDAPGCFVYRTLDDLAAIRDYAGRSRVGVVVGGGLLGLEAAHALSQLGLQVHVVEFAPRLMALQLDEVGGGLLRSKIEALGVSVHTGKSAAAVELDGDRAAGLRFADGSSLSAELIVFSAGIRPRDQLARECGLELGARGGIVVDDQCRTSDRDVFAIG